MREADGGRGEPAAAGPVVAETRRDVSPSCDGGPGPLLLVVDDEEVVRRAVCRFLERSGFEVACAADGESAVRVFVERRPRLVLLDVSMPGLGGRGAFEALRATDPSAKVVLLSGHDPDDVVGFEGAAGFLRKPFRIDALVSLVRRCLEAS